MPRYAKNADVQPLLEGAIPATRVKKLALEQSTAQRLSSIIKSVRDIMRKDKGLSGDADRLPMLTWMMFLKFLDDLEFEGELEARLENKTYRPMLEPPYRWPDWGELSQDVALELMAHLIFMLHDLERDRLHQRRIALQL